MYTILDGGASGRAKRLSTPSSLNARSDSLGSTEGNGMMEERRKEVALGATPTKARRQRTFLNNSLVAIVC
jgi:hypothetical protein